MVSIVLTAFGLGHRPSVSQMDAAGFSVVLAVGAAGEKIIVTKMQKLYAADFARASLS